MFYNGTTHYNEFINLLRSKNKIYDSGGINKEYGSAFYILTADEEIRRKSTPYIVDFIDFEEILKNNDFSSGYRILIKLAWNLYNNCNSDTTVEIKPLDLTGLDEDNFKIAMNAIMLRRYSKSVEDLEPNPQGRPPKVDFKEVQALKNEGKTQEQTARELNVSLSTVRRFWK